MTDLTTQHASDCAVHNGPALPPGRCDCGADLTTLSTLLGSLAARDAAPCVPFKHGQWVLLRNGRLINTAQDWLCNQQSSGKHDWGDDRPSSMDCIWSGDLPALLSALVAERDGMAGKVRRLGEALCRYGDRIRMAIAPPHLQEDIDEAMASALKEQ